MTENKAKAARIAANLDNTMNEKKETRGRPRLENKKIWTSIRLTPELHEKIKALGKPSSVIETILNKHFNNEVTK